MYWAKDQLGNLVQATERSSFSYGLRCPMCGRPVFRKAGPYRRAHFSHFGYGAKPECEYYHPPIDAIRAPTRPSHLGSSVPRDETPYSPGGIFLRRNLTRGASLVLRLPRIASIGDRDSDEIAIVSGLGSKTFTVRQLQKPRYVPVIAGSPIARVTSEDGLLFLCDAIERDVEEFELTGNFFRLSEFGGRLLQRNAPLELGASYWLITRAELTPPPTSLGVTVRLDGARRGWHHYELALQDPTIGDSSGVLDALAQYLGRPVRMPGHSVFFIDPPCHHIEIDGTHVFPEGVPSILVHYTPGARVSFSADNGSQGISVQDDGLGWARVTNPPRGYFSCLVDGHEHLVGSVESCPLFKAGGILVGIGDERRTPLVGASALSTLEQTINVVCPSERVAEFVHSLNPNSSREALAIRITRPTSASLWLNAGNFGRLGRLEPAIAPAVQIVKSDGAAAQWLFGVLQRYFPGSTRFRGLTRRELEAICLAPHIRTFAPQQRDGLQEY